MKHLVLPYFKNSLLILLVSLGYGCHYYHISGERVTALEVSEDEIADTSISEFIAPYSQKLGEAMDETIGSSAVRLYKAKPESPLGNLLSDIVQTYAIEHSDNKERLFSVVNYGGIRLDELSEGDISVETIYELLPFENRIVIVDMTEKELKVFLDHISRRGPWPVSSELSYKISMIDSSATDIRINDKALIESSTYSVAMPDYIANGGDDCYFLKELKNKDTGHLLRDVVIEFIRNQKEDISSKIEGRIIYGQ